MDIIPQMYFVSNILRFSYFLEKNLLVIGQVDRWHKMLLKYGVYVSQLPSEKDQSQHFSVSDVRIVNIPFSILFWFWYLLGVC